MDRLICQLCKKEIETPDYGDGILDESDVYEWGIWVILVEQ